MKKLKKLKIKKVTLRDLDETSMQGVAGGISVNTNCPRGSLCTAGQGHPCC
jgi:natural product precursor